MNGIEIQKACAALGEIRAKYLPLIAESARTAAEAAKLDVGETFQAALRADLYRTMKHLRSLEGFLAVLPKMADAAQ